MDFSSEMSSKMPVVTGGESWPGKEGISGISSGAAMAARGVGRGNVDENEGRGSSNSGVDWGKSLDKNWEEAMAAASEGLSLNQEKNGNFMKFALADLSSAVAGAHRCKNSGYPHSMISYTQAQNPGVHARKPATLSLQSQKLLLGGMIPCNAANSSPQIPPYGFPIPYNPTYHVNSSSMSGCQFSPPTVEKSNQNEKVQNNRSLSELLNLQEQGNREKEDGSVQSMGSLFQFAQVTSEKHVWNERTQNKESSSKLIDFGQDVRGNQDGSLHSWGSSLPFAPETPEKNAQNERALNNQSPAMLIDFGLNERSNQERNQGYSFQYGDSPGNDAIEICCDQDLSQSSAIHHSQFAPATPAKNPQNETTQNNQYPSTLIDFNVKEIGNQEKNQGCSLLSRVSPGNEAFEICFDQGLTQSSAQLDEIPNAGKGEIHVIDLNKTPQQKTRRKKHRPKVINEKKSKRTPKTATPKQSGSQENATGRKSHKHSQTPLPCVGEPAAAQPGKLDIPSCKRSLNFESESKSGDRGLGTSEIYHNELDNREDVSKVANLQAVEGPQVENRSSGITIDLNYSMAEWPDSNLASSQNLTMSSPLKRKIPSRENLKDMARKRSNIGIMRGTVEGQDNGNSPNRDSYEVLQDDPGSVIESQLDSSIGSQPPSTHNQLGFKELNQEYGHTAQNSVFHSFNLVGPHMNPMKTHLEMLQRFQYPGNGKNHNEHCFRIYKKERTRRPKNGTNKTTFDMSSFSMPMAQAQIPAKFQREDRMGIGFHKPQDYGSMLALSQIELKTKKRSKAITRIRNMANFFVSRCDQMLAMHLNRTLGHDVEQGQDISHGPQSCVEALITNNQAKMVTKKRTKKVSHDSSSTPFSPTNQVHAQKDEIIVYDNRQCFVGSTSSLLGPEAIRSNASPRKLKTQDLHLPQTNFVHDCQSSSNLCGAVAMVPLADPIDEIVHRLKYLNINRGDETVATQTENALVPYVRDETMIPYEGPFDLMKKRRPRPKVDLDMETLRQWKLLMGKDSRENLEGTDEDKEKWWEEEQRVFRGRADSFIARMHLVLGDRRFSQWKGSVVDSVVGVFLTQNVSDHLSSSAFMSLAARFPLQSEANNGAPNTDEINMDPPEPDVCVLEFNTMKWQDKLTAKQMPDQSSMTHHEPELGDEKEITNSSESFGSNVLGSKANCPKGMHSAICETGQTMCHQSTENREDMPVTETSDASLADAEDRRSAEDISVSIISSQNSTDSTIQVTDRIASSSESNSETDEQITRCRSCSFDSPTSFTELLHMAGTQHFQKIYMNENATLLSDGNLINGLDQFRSKEPEQRKSSLARLDGLKCSCSSVCSAHSNAIHTHCECIEDAGVFSVNYNSDLVGSACPASETTGSKASDVTEVWDNSMSKRTDPDRVQLKLQSATCNIASENSDKTLNESQISHPLNTKQASPERDPISSSNPPREMTKSLSGNKKLHTCSDLPADNTTNLQNSAVEASFHAHVSGNGIHIEALSQNGNFTMQPLNSSLVNYEGETSDIVDCSGLTDNLSPMERKNLEPSSRDEVTVEGTYDALKPRKRKGVAENKNPVDWDSLRTQAMGNHPPKERSHGTQDSLDWEAVRCAEVGDIAHTIRERGMNNMLAERIKDFLNRLVREHGSLDLEWLRDVPPEKAKDYLLSIRGLGLKSVECVRLLALQHLAFPVDTNVGRICVRLGWVPLQPLPESLQLHLLELYPVQESIQKYLWPRLCKLDQRTLYELHYQLITFGKVFCTKSRPNCNACPMRGECKHFASAFASARLALPGPEERSLISRVAPIMTEPANKTVINPRLLAPLPSPEADTQVQLQADSNINKCEPVIEEPATPEHIESSESVIEDIEIEDTPYTIECTPYDDPDEIPTIKLDLNELTLHVQNYIQENKMELQEADMSKALVTLTPEAASIPMPKLKNVNRLRTEHQVYELPDTHPLLEGLDPREPDDPCSYLLAIWTPGETSESIKPPETGCNSQGSGNLCDKETCFACNSIREANAETVRGTLLIPCRTAMRGSFPLNGTYFQVNEVFADHDSSLTPIDVPRAWIWNLPRRTVFFGTSIPTIFRGLTTEGIQYCFWRGFVCVRGFDRTGRAPRPLMARLHFPASKLTRSRKGPTKEEQ